MAYTVRIKPRAGRQLRKLPRPALEAIGRAIDGLAKQPRPPGATKIQDSRIRNLYRIRVGDYRVVYQVKDKTLVVLVVHVGHRRDVYRSLH